MAARRRPSNRWIFSQEQMENTPSRRCGVEPDRELSYRQQAANLIQDIGQRLNVTQLAINTAVVYMHRFYMIHSFTKFHRNVISPTALLLAAKVEEQQRKVEHIIKVAHSCLNPQEPPLDTRSNAYIQQAQELVILESIMLQTLGFEITIGHPHTDVVKLTQLVRVSKDLAQTSYFMATNSIHLTTFCLQYKPTVIACVCIHLVCKWSFWEISKSTDGKHWWEYVDSSVTLELLDELTHEFLLILKKTPSWVKKIRSWRAAQAAKKSKADGQSSDSSSLDGSSLIQDQSVVDAIPGVSVNAAFPKPSTSFPVSLPGNPGNVLSLDSVSSMQGTSYTPSDWPQDQEQMDTYSVKQPPPDHPHRHDKGAEFNPNTVKHEHKANNSGKHQTAVYPPPAPPPQPQKMSLEKYKEKHKEKHATELAAQKHRQEQQQSSHSETSSVQTEHRKHLHLNPHSSGGSSSTSAASPLKVKLHLPAQDKPKDVKREKSSLLKLRIPVPTQGEKDGACKEELKMKIKVSSERHSSSDEGSSKVKRSSPLVVKEKDREHSQGHRHHHKHLHSHSGNSKSPANLSSDGNSSVSGSSRKRTHLNSSQNHHHSSKKSKSSGSGSGGLRTSHQGCETGQEASGESRP